MISNAGHIEIEYDKSIGALFLSSGDDPYEVNMIGVHDIEEASLLITALKEFINIKESKSNTINN